MTARKITLTGRFRYADGRPATGTLSFTPTAVVTDRTTVERIEVSPIFAALGTDAAGASSPGFFSVDLTATTGPDVNPTGWGWIVREQINGITNREAYTINLPYDTPGGGVDLASVVPSAPVADPTFAAAATGGASGPTGDPSIDTATVNAAKAAGLTLQPGTYIVNKITVDTGDALLLSPSTVLQLANGVNDNLIESAGYSTFVGTDATATPHSFTIAGGTLDGNKAGNPTGKDVVAVFAYAYRLDSVILRNAKGWGLNSEWSAASPFVGPDAMESFVTNTRIHDCDTGAVRHVGPHDTQFVNNIWIKNSGAATGSAVLFPTDGKSNGSIIVATHIWGGVYDYCINSSCAGISTSACQFEGGRIAQVWAQADEMRFRDTRLFTGGVNTNTAKGLLLGRTGRTVSNIDFDGSFYDCGGGIVDFTNANSHIRIRAHAQWQAATLPPQTVIGTIPAWSDFDVYYGYNSGPVAAATTKHLGGQTVLEAVDGTQVPLSVVPFFGGQNTDLVRAQTFKVGANGYLGLGGANPNASIPVLLETGADAARALVVYPHSTNQTGNLIELQHPSTFRPIAGFDRRGRLFAGTEYVPTIARGAAATSAASDTAAGGVADQAGAVTVTALAAPVAGALATVTFSATLGGIPKSVQITPRSVAARNAGLYVSAKSSAAFTVSCAAAPAASARLTFDYWVIP